MIRYLSFLLFFFIPGNSFLNTFTVNVKLNPRQAGWYFIEILKDTTKNNDGMVIVRFKDAERYLSVKINNINETIVHPSDLNGNDISARLKYFSVRETASNESFFQFYNPTDTEIKRIEHWDPTDERAQKILDAADVEFNKHYHE